MMVKAYTRSYNKVCSIANDICCGELSAQDMTNTNTYYLYRIALQGSWGHHKYLEGLLSIILVLIMSFISFETQAANPHLIVDQLTCEYATNPIGINSDRARLGWVIQSDQRATYQSGYQILVASSEEKLGGDVGDIWDSGKVDSDQSTHVPFAKPLTSRERYYWKVRVWDQNGQVSDYSPTAYWEVGLEEEDWMASWITSPTIEDANDFFPQRKKELQDENYQRREASPIFRKVFEAKKEPKKATLYICGLGYYELFVNGRPLNQRSLDPAFTDYNKTVYYSAYDVTEMLHTGKNAIGVMLGNGFFNSETLDDWGFDLAPWRDRPNLIVQLEIAYEDGSITRVVSDPSWKVRNGPVVTNSLREGILYDARKEITDWNLPLIDDHNWPSAIRARPPLGRLQPSEIPPVKAVEIFKPKSVKRLASGHWLIDAGVNIAGWAAIQLKGERGDTLVLKYGERLHADGSLDNDHISGKTNREIQVDTYIMKGAENEKYEPHFVYYGFQYIEVQGYDGVLSSDDIDLFIVRTSFKKTGSFSSSNSTLNWIHEANQRSYESNFHSIPTDCPHREKNGWTGDAHLAAETGFYNYRVATSLTKWMNDVRDAQKADGHLPGIIPTPGWGYQIYHNILDPMGPAWDGASVILPWYLYLYVGDTQVLSDNYETMKGYLRTVEQRSKNHIASFGIGDWAAPNSETHWSVTSTAYYYALTNTLVKTARILQKPEDQQYFQSLSENIKIAFNEHFLDIEQAQYGEGTQTAHAIALYQGLVETRDEQTILRHLLDNIKERDYHIDCGILGTKPLYRVLGEYGYIDIAFEMLTKTDYPSYGYWKSQGATTLWESWRGDDSRNHVMFGDISAWMYSYLAGIRPVEDQPGFKEVLIAPQVPDGLSFVSAQTETPYGKIKSAWEATDEAIDYTISVSPNTTAEIALTCTPSQTVTEGGISIDKVEGILAHTRTSNQIVLEVGSGDYSFRVQ